MLDFKKSFYSLIGLFLVSPLLLSTICCTNASAQVPVAGAALGSKVGSKVVTGADSPEALQISTPVYQASFDNFDPPLGTYYFTVAWQGIPAAEATLSLQQEGLNYRVITSARTYSGIDWIYKMRYRNETLISAVDLMPIMSKVRHQENSKVKEANLTFHEDGKIESVRRRNGEFLEAIELATGNFTLDPVSSAFMARSLDWAVGVQRDFDAFNGKSRYLITLECVDETNLKVDGVNRRVWVISPRVRNLSESNSSEKLKEAKIYITTDNSREVVRLVSEVFIGSVTTKFDRFVPYTGAPSQQLLALRANKKKSLLN